MNAPVIAATPVHELTQEQKEFESARLVGLLEAEGEDEQFTPEEEARAERQLELLHSMRDQHADGGINLASLGLADLTEDAVTALTAVCALQRDDLTQLAALGEAMSRFGLTLV